MPAKTEKQARFMRAVAHSPQFAKKVGVPMSVGKEFSSKESGMARTKKMATGGLPDQASIRARAASAPAAAARAPAAPPVPVRAPMPVAPVAGRPMKKGGKTEKYAKGGVIGKMGKVTSGGTRAHGEHTVQQKGHTKAKQVVMAGGKGMKRGGKC